MAIDRNPLSDAPRCVLCGHVLTDADRHGQRVACADNTACIGRWWRRVAGTSDTRERAGLDPPAVDIKGTPPGLEGDG